MKHLFTLLIVFLAIYNAQSQIAKQSNAVISNISFFITADSKMKITYDILESDPSDKFNVTFNVITESGNKLNAKTATGDLKNVSAGFGKEILWDMGKDIEYLNEKIHIEIEAKQINFKVVPYTTRNKAILFSTFLPGAGSTRLGQNSLHLFKGLAAYAFIGLSIKYNRNAVSAYDKYKISTNPITRNELIDDAEKNRRNSKIMFYSAVAIWAIDYLNIMLMKNKTDKQDKNVTFYPIVYPVNGKPCFGLALTF